MFTCFFSRQFFPTGFLGFRTHVVATTVCTTVSVHTLTCRTHIFLLHSLSAHIRTYSCVSTHTNGSSVRKRFFAHVILLHLAFSLLMIHPSLLFPHVHFETNPDYDFIDKPIHMILPYFSRLESARHILFHRLSLNSWEDHQGPLHCHQMEEELDDGCRS